MQSVLTHLQAGWQQAAAIENIGLGGARVVVDNAIAPGDTVSLSFTAPTLWDPLVLRARVAWVAPSPTSPSSAHPPQPGHPAKPAQPGAPATARTAGVAFEHKSTDAVFALYELIVTLGYE